GARAVIHGPHEAKARLFRIAVAAVLAVRAVAKHDTARIPEPAIGEEVAGSDDTGARPNGEGLHQRVEPAGGDACVAVEKAQELTARRARADVARVQGPEAHRILRDARAANGLEQLLDRILRGVVHQEQL